MLVNTSIYFRSDDISTMDLRSSLQWQSDRRQITMMKNSGLRLINQSKVPIQILWTGWCT